jgi:glycine/D-amino acid oxidase-like deaminating enzyme
MGYGGDEIYTRMARCSLAEWNELFERTGEALFHRTGVLWMGRAGEPYSESTRSTLERAGVPNRDPVCPGTGPTISADACAGIKLVRHFGAGERRLEGAACDRHCGAGPDLEGRGCKLAFDRHGAPFDPDSGGRKVSAESAAEARAFLAERIPPLRDAPLTEAQVCQYENTSNGDFLIDGHPELTNVWLAGGGSGHRFKHGPAVAA